MHFLDTFKEKALSTCEVALKVVNVVFLVMMCLTLQISLKKINKSHITTGAAEEKT